MTQWEYLTLRPATCNSSILDSLGISGWELVCIDATGIYIFKRPRQPEPDPFETVPSGTGPKVE